MPVAILNGPASAGAYESVRLAFPGREGVRSFGDLPGGPFPEVVESFPALGRLAALADDASSVDHAGRIVDGQIKPDVAASMDWTDASDPARAAAATWLAEQGSCP